MSVMDELMDSLGPIFGVLAESNTYQLTVIARNTDVAIGDLFLLPCRRGPDRFYVFRTTQYANVLNRTLDMNDVARNKLTMPDSYFADDISDEKLIELKGMVLGYAELEAGGEWGFHRPRRLPQHLSEVYRVDHENPSIAETVRTLMGAQLGKEGLYVGDLLAGESALQGVQVSLPAFALSNHIGVFGQTGSGKSNLMMVLLNSVLNYNHHIAEERMSGPRASILAIDPHDEFRHWHAAIGGADGLSGIVGSYTDVQRREIIEPFYYITAKDIGDVGLERRVTLSRADVIPDDLASIIDFTEQQTAFASQYYAQYGERWVGRLLLGEVGLDGGLEGEGGGEYLPGTIAAVQRRIGFLRRGHTRVFTRFDPEAGQPYSSLLPDIICALERGRVIVVDTTLMTEVEQFLLTTIVARVLFSLRKALRSAEDADSLPTEIRQALGNDDSEGQIGMRSLADELLRRLETGELPYRSGGQLSPLDQLPHVNVVVEEAPSLLNPQRMKFGSVFRDISRQGRKFRIGLTVVSQQVSEIDQGVLAQINTELTMALGNEIERKEAVRNASADLSGFERELQVLGKGQVILSSSYRDIPLPIQVPDYDSLKEVSNGW